MCEDNKAYQMTFDEYRGEIIVMDLVMRGEESYFIARKTLSIRQLGIHREASTQIVLLLWP